MPLTPPAPPGDGRHYSCRVFPGLIARPLRASLILLALVAVGAGFWVWHRATSSTEVPVGDAVREFRASGDAAAGPRPGVPRPGVYRMRQSGRERGGVGPVSLSRALPGSALYVVTLRPGGYREELDISREHVESVDLRVRPEGAHAVARRSKVTFLGLGRDDRRTLVPPPLRMPARLRVGATWSDRYAAGTIPFTARATVLRKDAVTIDGRSRPVMVVRSVTDTGGTHPGRRTDTMWWSPGLSLPLRWTIDMEIRGVARLRTRSELVMETLEPTV